MNGEFAKTVNVPQHCVLGLTANCFAETGTPSAEQEGWCSASSVKEMVLRYCEQHEGVDLGGKEPYFGQ